jgi:hypothetical protein
VGCAAGLIVDECRQESQAVKSQDLLPINPDLVWDYVIPDDGHQDEAFRQWYIREC